jgi:hypothetical protein
MAWSWAGSGWLREKRKRRNGPPALRAEPSREREREREWRARSPVLLGQAEEKGSFFFFSFF